MLFVSLHHSNVNYRHAWCTWSYMSFFQWKVTSYLLLFKCKKSSLKFDLFSVCIHMDTLNLNPGGIILFCHSGTSCEYWWWFKVCLAALGIFTDLSRPLLSPVGAQTGTSGKRPKNKKAKGCRVFARGHVLFRRLVWTLPSSWTRRLLLLDTRGGTCCQILLLFDRLIERIYDCVFFNDNLNLSFWL